MGNWSIETQVLMHPHNPLIDSGPAITIGTLNGVQGIYTASIGQGGHELYSSSCPYDPNVPGGFLNWQGNTTIAPPNGKALKSTDRPAIAIFDGLLYVVYPEEGSGRLMMTTSDGLSWTYTNEVTAFVAHGKWKQPAMMVFNNRLYLVACDSLGSIWCSFKDTGMERDGSTDNWKPAVGMVMQGSYPSLAVHQNQLNMVFSILNGSMVLMTLQPGADLFQWISVATVPAGPDANPGVAIASNGTQLFLVYTGHGGHALYYSWFIFAAAGFTLNPSFPIEGAFSAAKTDAPPGLAAFQNNFYLVHKGNGNNKMYCSFYS